MLKGDIAEQHLIIEKSRHAEVQAVNDAESALREATHTRDDANFLTNENKRL